MSATDELRRMLDERGVEWESKDVEGVSGFHDTRWNAYDVRWCYVEFVGNNYTKLKPSSEFNCTPEQAIAATLGSEFNHDGLPVGLTISDDSNLLNWRGENYVKQSTLGGGTLTANDVLNAVYKHGARWQAIADDLNATLGGGECELHECEGSFSALNRPVWRCDCGAFMTQYTDATTYHKPRFCPNCGRKAVKR